MQHHGTIRKYTAALLDVFNGLEVEYLDSNSNTITRNIPIVYSSREKSRIIEGHTAEQLASGNTNVLPRANISLSTLAKADQRVTNKNIKINKAQGEDTFEYMFNSVPYEFTFELTVMCRGMNEASMIIEQVAPKFNPTLNVDIWDATNLNEPTRVPIRLLDIGIEQEEYEEYSTNLVIISFGLSLMGNLYPPIKSTPRIHDFKMYINEHIGDYFNRKTIMGWDVNADGELENGTLTQVEDTTTYAPSIISINAVDSLSVGTNSLVAVYDDSDNQLGELTFDWALLSGTGTLVGDLDRATLTVTSAGAVEVQLTITDAFGNYNSLTKQFTI